MVRYYGYYSNVSRGKRQKEGHDDAILYYGKTRGGFYGDAIYRQAMGWVVGLVIFGLLVPGINNWAHGGGIVSGILLARLLGYSEWKEETTIHHALSAGCVILTAAVFLWVIIQTAYIFIFTSL